MMGLGGFIRQRARARARAVTGWLQAAVVGRGGHSHRLYEASIRAEFLAGAVVLLCMLPAAVPGMAVTATLALPGTCLALLIIALALVLASSAGRLEGLELELERA